MPEFDADVVDEIDKQVGEFERDLLLDRRVGDVIPDKDLVEIVNGGDRVVPVKNV